MKKVIIIILLIIIVAAGGWYLYSQQGAENSEAPEATTTESTTSKDVSGEKDTGKSSGEKQAGETEIDEDNPYAKAEAVPAIPGLNEKIHQRTEAVLESVFEQVKLTSTNSDSNPGDNKFAYWGDYEYIVSEVISQEKAGQIRESMIEEGFEIDSTDVDSDKYRYRYNFEVDGKEYSGNMGVNIGEGRGLQTINLDAFLEN